MRKTLVVMASSRPRSGTRHGQGRTIAFALPGRFRVKAMFDDPNLVENIEAWIPSPVLGDMAVEVSHSDYRDFGGVKFPTKIRQTAGGFPALDHVRPNLYKAIGRAR